MATILRDDSALRSLSSNERTFVRNCATATLTSSSSSSIGINGDDGGRATSVLRIDGRHPGEIRSIRLTFGRTHMGRSECTVQLGVTRVACIVTCDLVPPQSRPNDGSIKFSVDLSPMAEMGFSSSLDYDENKKHMANRIARVIEKTIVDGGAIDVESLCVVGGTWVWRINVDITALDHGGNLVDASMLATIAALRHFRKPEVILSTANSDGDAASTVIPEAVVLSAEDTTTTTTTKNNNNSTNSSGRASGAPIILSSDEKEPTPLPLHHSPVCVTFGLFGDPTGASSLVAALIDPSDREELIMDGLITYAFNKYGELCSLDFPGGCELRYSQLVQCANLAEKKAVELCTMLEEALEAAEEKAWKERMERLSKLSSSSVVVETTHRTRGGEEIGLFSVPELDYTASEVVTTTSTQQQQLQMTMITNSWEDDSKCNNFLASVEEEEKYRLQALDYSLGHVAMKVKENKEGDGISSRVRSEAAAAGGTLGGKLIHSMIRAAEGNTSLLKSNIVDSNQPPRPYDEQDLNPSTNLLKECDDSRNSRRRIDAEEEFEAYALRAQNQIKDVEMKSSINGKMEIDNDDDDEDEVGVIVLQSEFATIEPVVEVTVDHINNNAEVPNKKQTYEEEDDDIDLYMAIKRKSKGSKSRKKK